MKSKRSNLINLYISGCLFIVVKTVSAEDVTGKGIAEVALEVPYPTRLYNEAPQFTVKLKNISSSDLIYIPKEADASGKQVFIRVERGDSRFAAWEKHAPPENRVRIIDNSRWDDVYSNESQTRLGSGQDIGWSGYLLNFYNNFMFNQGDPRSIQVSILVGDGKWVSSRPVPIKQLPLMVDDFPIIYSYNSEKHKDLKIVLAEVYRGEVEGKEYLFSMGRMRICEIPAGVKPKFNFDENLRILEITFDEGSNERQIRFDNRFGGIISSSLKLKTELSVTEPPVTNVPPATPKVESMQPTVKPTISSNVTKTASSPSVTQPEQPRTKAWWLIAGVAVLGVIVWRIKRK